MKSIKFSLSLDDHSPHPRAGFNFESVEWCNKLIKQFPNLKINLFVPAAYCRLGEKPCFLSNYTDWVKKVNDLPKNNYSINFHGLYHRRVDGKHQNSNNDEFMHLNESDANTIINAMIKEFDLVGLKYRKVFRPPGWRISTSATKVLTNRGFVIAGNDIYYKLHKDSVSNLKWVSYNWDLVEECKIKKGNVIAYGHTSDWTNNYMNKKRYNLIKELLESKEFEFVFIENLVGEKNVKI
jgi:hypothetical protein